MTDKQLEEKKKELLEYIEHYVNIIVAQTNPANQKVYTKYLLEGVDEKIEELIKEVGREAYKKGLIDQSIRDVTN